MSEDKQVKQRAFFVTVWGKCIHNLKLGKLLDADNKPLDGTGEAVLTRICDKFEASGKGRKASGSACLSPTDGFHLHLGVYSETPMTLSAVSKKLGNAHVEPQRATKEQLIAYITKSGEYAEKGEQVLYVTENMDGVTGRQGNRSDLEDIGDMIKAGCKPNDIFDYNIKYRKHEKIVKQVFFRKRFLETPEYRQIYVEWHVGESRTGKTYTYIDLCKQYGADEIYMLSDYENGGFDDYSGEKILFMDEFRGQIRYSTLLMILQGYKQQLHSRYSNIYGLWDKVYISSILPPDAVYKRMVSDDKDLDTEAQLFGRIAKVVYHYKDGDKYKTVEQSMAEYTDYATLRSKATDGFVKLTPAEEKYVQEYLF